MAWRLAKSLETLRTQVNTSAPNRSKLSDGTIGDSAHAAVASDHNPDGNGVVKAMDLTHDPAHGADMQKIADSIIASGDPRIWYIIFNYRIWEVGVGWQAYHGSNPHDKHAHFNTVHTPSLYDNTNNWKIGGEVTMTPDALNMLAQAAWNTPVSGTDKFVKDYTGKSPEATIGDVLKSHANVLLRTKASNYDGTKAALDAAYKMIEDLKANGQGAVTQAEIDALAAKAEELEQSIKNVNK